MKAEHRKELQTNLLADRMGKLVQKIKTRPQRRTVVYILLGLAVVLAIYLFMRYRSTVALETSETWFQLDDGHRLYLLRLAGFVQEQDGKWRFSNPTKGNAQRAARLQLAWIDLWDQGIKQWGADWRGALINVRSAEGLYKYLEEECKEDPVLHPEVLYALGVIEETKAVQDRESLKNALERFKEVSKKYPASAFGKKAAQRAELLENEKERAKIAEFYADLQRSFRIDAKELRPER